MQNVLLHYMSFIFEVETTCFASTLENTERTIKYGQSRETVNIGYTRRRQTKQKHNTLCVETPQYTNKQ